MDLSAEQIAVTVESSADVDTTVEAILDNSVLDQIRQLQVEGDIEIVKGSANVGAMMLSVKAKMLEEVGEGNSLGVCRTMPFSPSSVLFSENQCSQVSVDSDINYMAVLDFLKTP